MRRKLRRKLDPPRRARLKLSPAHLQGARDQKFAQVLLVQDLILEARHISFGYTSDNPLFRHMNLVINARDRFGVIDNNGKGKSTLLNLLSGGLIPVTRKLKAHPDMIGYFGQTNIQRLNPKLTIEQEIEHTHPAPTRMQVRRTRVMLFSIGARRCK